MLCYLTILLDVRAQISIGIYIFHDEHYVVTNLPLHQPPLHPATCTLHPLTLTLGIWCRKVAVHCTAEFSGNSHREGMVPFPPISTRKGKILIISFPVPSHASTWLNTHNFLPIFFPNLKYILFPSHFLLRPISLITSFPFPSRSI